MTLSLDFLALPLLVAASLVFVSVLAGVLSARVGFSFLLVFLLFTFRVPKRLVTRDEGAPQEALLPFLRERKRLMGLMPPGSAK